MHDGVWNFGCGAVRLENLVERYFFDQVFKICCQGLLVLRFRSCTIDSAGSLPKKNRRKSMIFGFWDVEPVRLKIFENHFFA